MLRFCLLNTYISILVIHFCSSFLVSSQAMALANFHLSKSISNGHTLIFLVFLVSYCFKIHVFNVEISGM